MNYIIVPYSHVKYVDFRTVEQVGPDSLRYSLDGKHFLLKYKGDQPKFIFAMTKDAIGLQEYTHSEILKILNGPKWKKRR